MMDETGRSADDGDGSCGTPLTRNRLLLMSGLASGRAAGAGKGGRVTQRAWRISGLEALDFRAWNGQRPAVPSWVNSVPSRW